MFPFSLPKSFPFLSFKSLNSPPPIPFQVSRSVSFFSQFTHNLVKFFFFFFVRLLRFCSVQNLCLLVQICIFPCKLICFCNDFTLFFLVLMFFFLCFNYRYGHVSGRITLANSAVKVGLGKLISFCNSELRVFFLIKFWFVYYILKHCLTINICV